MDKTTNMLKSISGKIINTLPPTRWYTGFKFLVVCACFLVCGLSLNVSAEVLFGETCYQRLHKHISQAEDSITVAMYFIIIDPKDSSNPINTLVDDLIEAKNRGVDVRVILEDSKLKANLLAFKKLKDNGVDVCFDTPKHLLHIKGIVIDRKYIFIGSTNWSRAAIEDNYEAMYFGNSPADAVAFEEYVDNIPIEKENLFLPEIEGVGISSSFLISPWQGRILLKEQAYKQLELYLLLCKIQQETGKSYLRIDYDSLAKKMGYAVPDDLGKYSNAHDYFFDKIRQLLVPLRKHGLIAYKKGRPTLKANKINASDKPNITIPFKYWEYGYSSKLSMRAKYMYLICLYEANRSTRYPSWFRSQEDMSKLYGISDTTISLGLLELEEKGLIDVIRDKPTPPDFADRKANIYRLLPLSRETSK